MLLSQTFWLVNLVTVHCNKVVINIEVVMRRSAYKDCILVYTSEQEADNHGTELVVRIMYIFIMKFFQRLDIRGTDISSAVKT